ncbi:MAG: tRNA lysidine(34) synthetase TilS [Syntrophothermus sp.]
MNKIEQKVIRFISDEYLVEQGDKILIALSGGPDSVFLVHFFNKYKKKYSIEIKAFHLNHQIRGIEADEDEAFCRGLCKSLNVELFTSNKDVKEYAKKNKLSLEEAGRILRYEELFNIVSKYNLTKIVTGHNKSDNLETVLLNIIKGTGKAGLTGIPVKRDKIIRPIICLKKEEIINYLEENSILFRVDSSNKNNDFNRNYLRNNLIPSIKENLNPDIEKAVLNFSNYIKSISTLIDKKINSSINSSVKKIDDKVKIFINKIDLEDELINDFFKEVLEKNFKKEVVSDDLIKLRTLLYSTTGNEEQLSGKLTAIKERDYILIYHKQEEKEFKSIKLKVNEEKEINGESLIIEEVKEKPVNFIGGKIEFIASDDLDEEFEVRKWKEGDKFSPIGLKGVKKVSDFLNDIKIDNHIKSDIKVLVNRERIVWVIGYRIDNKFKLTSNTERIYKLCLK